MKIHSTLPGMTGLGAGIIAASCCLLPIGLILLGFGTLGWALLGSLMQYQYLTIPAGILLLMAAYYLYRRENRRCESQGCRMRAKGFTRVALGLATLVVMGAVFGVLFPSAVMQILP